MGQLDFRTFYCHSVFTLLAEGNSNWDYYQVEYPGRKPLVAALAKPGTGAQDCWFGDMAYFNRMRQTVIKQ